MTIPVIRELSKLQQSLRGQRVLSAYFTVKASDPAQRNQWRAQVKSELRKLSKSLDALDNAEQRAFGHAREALEAIDLGVLTHADGVACFATARGIQRIERLPFAAETSVSWGLGVALAPFVRALKQRRPVILAVADRQSARIYRYDNGPFTELEALHVEPHLRQPTHMSGRIGPKFHPGTHGVAGQDLAQREWDAATERLAHRVAHQLAHHAGDTAWVILGGRTDVVHHIESALPKSVQLRTGEVPGVSVQSGHRELELAASAGASFLRDSADIRELRHLADSGDERHAAAVGENAARRALDRAAVSRLYISSRYLVENAVRAESAVQAALEQGADIETVSGIASTTLDAMGGIAARLRYSTN